MKITIYRIQDKKGRGPYKPGFSHRWVESDDNRPAVMEEFGWDFASKALPSQAVGCAFRSIAQLRRWFTETEISKLYELGYAITRLDADGILHESEKQLVIARNKPLHSGVKRLALNEALTESVSDQITAPL